MLHRSCLLESQKASESNTLPTSELVEMCPKIPVSFRNPQSSIHTVTVHLCRGKKVSRL